MQLVIERLVDEFLPAVVVSAVRLEEARRLAVRVDGRIIGTGEADFTKGNSSFTLKFQEKTFQLIDVPGIEGDEKRFASMVQEAVARAHLVFYVNGTNKKPEKATAEKIRSYLRRGTQVCPLVNVRGSADAYEFAEDRDSLEAHGGTDSAMDQTMGVLRASLGDEVLMEGYCVQGLLAFSAVAIDQGSGRTTIHPSRDRDLFIQQRNYLKYFQSPAAMIAFSRIESVADVLRGKLDTFKEDIIEANKTKVRELLSENIDVLNTARDDHERFIDKARPEFNKCREAISGAMKTFEQLVSARRKNIWAKFFDDLADTADDIVDKHFGDERMIQSELKQTFRSRQETLKSELQDEFKKDVNNLQDTVAAALERLVKDVSRVQFEASLAMEAHKSAYTPSSVDMSLGWREFGGIAGKIGGFALTGAGIGSLFPGAGNIIGGVVGAFVGVLAAAWGLMRGRAYRVRTAQGQVRDSINSQRQKFMNNLPQEAKSLVDPARESIEQVQTQIADVFSQLARPLEIIDQQIVLMTNLKNQLEEMPRGSIHAIQ